MLSLGERLTASLDNATADLKLSKYVDTKIFFYPHYFFAFLIVRRKMRYKLANLSAGAPFLTGNPQLERMWGTNKVPREKTI